MAGPESRKYKRLSTNWVVKLRTTKYSDTSIRRMQDRIVNISLGGVFIETGFPFDIGTHVEFDFAIPGQSDPVHARGVVRWSNDGRRLKDAPVGMGIEFLEVSTPHRDAIDQFVQSSSGRELIEPLLKTPLHRSLLRFYSRKMGERLPLDVLARFLGCRHSELLEVLREFAQFKIVTFLRDTVNFVPADNKDVAREIEGWYATIDHGDTPLGGARHP